MSLKIQLYPHQVEAAEFLINKKRCLLQHEQGLGKTVTALAAFEKLKELGKAKRCLVVGQSSYLFQWQRAIEKFTDSSYTFVERTNKDARSNYNHNTDYTLISYGLYRNDFKRLLLVDVDVFICDEAQEFANNKSKTAKLVKSYNLRNDPRYRWALTGTAIRSKLEHLYSIMYWVDKHFLPSWPTFEKRHIVRDERTNQITAYKNLVPLHEHLKNRAHRKTHKDVEGSIPKIIGPVIHTLPPSDEYIEAQDALLGTLDSLKLDISINDFLSPHIKSEVSKAFSRCRKLLSGSVKVNYLSKEIEKVLEENSVNRVVIFSYYKDPLYLLEKTLSEKSIKTSLFTGDQDAKHRENSIRRFSTDTRVLLVSNAGYKGLDLPMANFVYHIDIPFTFEILDQRNKRVTRLSSVHGAVVVNYLIIEGSIEKYYFDIVLNQGELLRATFDHKKDNVKIRTQSLRQYLNGHKDKDRAVSQAEEDKGSPRETFRGTKRGNKKRARTGISPNR